MCVETAHSKILNLPPHPVGQEWTWESVIFLVLRWFWCRWSTQRISEKQNFGIVMRRKSVNVLSDASFNLIYFLKLVDTVQDRKNILINWWYEVWHLGPCTSSCTFVNHFSFELWSFFVKWRVKWYVESIISNGPSHLMWDCASVILLFLAPGLGFTWA